MWVTPVFSKGLRRDSWRQVEVMLQGVCQLFDFVFYLLNQ